MFVKQINLPAIQPFASEYIKGNQTALQHFHTDFQHQDDFRSRAEKIKSHTYDRKELVRCIRKYMERFPSGSKTEESLSRLEKDALVVIGGQQAGLLTGPLYSIHKLISIIILARQQEAKLGVPVVPVFWIAGEDHDFLEINHVYTEKDGQLQKTGYPDRSDKKMASSITFDRPEMKSWIKKVFSGFGETKHTSALIKRLEQTVDDCVSITDLFAYMVMDLFKEEGLLVIDAADEGMRSLESAFFQQLIRNSETVTESVINQQELLSDQGFKPLIELDPQAANLFFTINDERHLLFKSDGLFRDKNNQISLTEDELLEIAETEPERLSNNVVTRPLMQEHLFPTLAFIAGPGEIAYWAELKSAFEIMGMEMPIVMPRLTITLMERNISQLLDEFEISHEEAVKTGAVKQKETYWNRVKNESLDREVQDTKRLLEDQYKKITGASKEMDPNFHLIIEKNLSYHLKQLDYLKRKSDDSIRLRHNIELNKFTRIEQSLRPFGGPQERIWNLYYYLNEYGPDLIKELMTAEYEFNHRHHVLYI
ncbi:bacillithiol biosynthesis cysteine-adding enzyme BshC [Jeotgalibacillus sp. R-1-5s-1]|uniref:bacillithiol biosynthesis cysteine-adding enzyme BshC n=1 Tax=Jeotgalibacillus sp. R-1-5s-1 TaxID=2555897 RepID=UPI00106C4BBF|nr:bacillithiol biosynthesis cysteine-adding enzyme BshC [Jeotgalibacillus sp. R-1-5s-1]TFE03582.1 bacillithiol biosynthesis cysteine-adding enzyme BshC [Jeotgalibacillus sp. R-1-5s-1]